MGFSSERWVWDSVTAPGGVQLSRDLQEAYFFIDPLIGSTGTIAVRGTKGFSDGQHYWELEFLEPLSGNSVMVGVATQGAHLASTQFKSINLIGQDEKSWGLSYKGKIYHNGTSKKYCEPFFDAGTRIGLLLDMVKGTLAFYKNGVHLGVAFTGLTGSPLYPVVSSTSSQTEVKVGSRSCRYLSLQEKCIARIRCSLKNIQLTEDLPLPNIMKRHIRGS